MKLVIDEQVLTAYALNELSPAMAKEVEAYLADHSDAAAEVAAIRETAGLLTAELAAETAATGLPPRPVVSPEHLRIRKSRRVEGMLALAASVALVAGAVTVTVRVISQGQDNHQTNTLNSRPVAKLSVDQLKSQAIQMTREKKYKEALVVIDQILAIDPNNDYGVGARPLVADQANFQEPRIYRSFNANPTTQPQAVTSGNPDDNLRVTKNFELSLLNAQAEGDPQKVAAIRAAMRKHVEEHPDITLSNDKPALTASDAEIERANLAHNRSMKRSQVNMSSSDLKKLEQSAPQPPALSLSGSNTVTGRDVVTSTTTSGRMFRSELTPRAAADPAKPVVTDNTVVTGNVTGGRELKGGPPYQSDGQYRIGASGKVGGGGGVSGKELEVTEATKRPAVQAGPGGEPGALPNVGIKQAPFVGKQYADRAPTITDSKQHDQDGQNVLTADGHAEFGKTPLAGSNKDNIYASEDKKAQEAAKGSPVVNPASASDDVLRIKIDDGEAAMSQVKGSSASGALALGPTGSAAPQRPKNPQIKLKESTGDSDPNSAKLASMKAPGEVNSQYAAMKKENDRRVEELAKAQLASRLPEPSKPGQAGYFESPPAPPVAEMKKEVLPDRGPNTESYANIVDNAFLAAMANPLSTFSIDVDSAAYSNLRRFITQGQLPPKDAVRIEEMVNYFPYQYEGPKEDGKPFAANVEVGACPWAPEHRLVRVGIKGREMRADQRPPSNLVFLIDVSGSMSDANKLPLVKESLRKLVNKLDSRDRVAMVVYAGSSGLVLESTQVGGFSDEDVNKLWHENYEPLLNRINAANDRPAQTQDVDGKENKRTVPLKTEAQIRSEFADEVARLKLERGGRQTILNAIDRLESGGSTNGGAGISLAYSTAESAFIKGGTNRVLLATDGDFNVGVTDQGSLTRLIEDKAKTGVFLSVLGFGMGNTKDDTMEKLADKGNGNYAYIDDIAEAQKVLVDQMSGTLVTIAKDVKIQVEFNPSKVSSYRLIGYENRVLAKEDFNNDLKDAGEIGAGHTVTALYEVVPPGVEVGGGGLIQKKIDGIQAEIARLKAEGATRDMTDEGSRKMSAQIAEMEKQVADLQRQLQPVDPLKYEPKAAVEEKKIIGAELNPKLNLSPDLLTVKIRYKAPDAKLEQGVSKLLEYPVVDERRADKAISPDFKFAAAVASFGMILRESPYRGSANLDSTIELATEGKGADANGYRQEFIELVKTTKAMTNR